MFEGLQELILSGCHLTRFGDDMRGLGNLKVLALNGNKMKVTFRSTKEITSTRLLEILLLN